MYHYYSILLAVLVTASILSEANAHNSPRLESGSYAHQHETQTTLYDDTSSEHAWEHLLAFEAPPLWNVKTAKNSNHARTFSTHAEYNKTLLPLVFEPFPLGSIKPLGWQRQQLDLMAEGMPGRMHEFYHLVKDAPWMGGDREYSPLNEAYTYYFDGIVPLAYGLNHERLKQHVVKSAEWLLEQQKEDGWLGPETNVRRRNFWGRYPLFLGFMQLAEAEPKLTRRIVKSMHKFVNLMHDMLSAGHQGYVWSPGDLFDEQWGRSRAADMIIALQWMYEKHPHENHEKLHDCMVWMYETAYDWSYWFSDEAFLKDNFDQIPNDLANSLFPYIHGVNAGQGLKSGAVMRRLTHEDRLLNTTRNGVDWTFQYHGTPSGAIIGDERMSGTSPVRGTELCSVIETMYSLNYLYQSLGDRSFADRAEVAAHNAMPAMILPFWWAHQYIAQTNQPVSQSLTGRLPFWNVGPQGTTFGTEPNYPCCAVRFSTGLPKYISHSWLYSRTNNSIIHTLLGPSELHTTLSRHNKIHIACTTNYPFSHLLTYDITARHPFLLSIRIPSWAILNNSGIETTYISAQPLHPDPHTGLHDIAIARGHTRVEIWFGASIRIQHHHSSTSHSDSDNDTNNTISIHHGALTYALSPSASYISSPAKYPTHPQARDWTIYPSSTWNMAIDPSSLLFYEYDNRYKAQLPNPIWAEDAPPVSISALACPISWNLTVGGFAPEPPEREEVEDHGTGGKKRRRYKCVGRAVPVELRPVGSAKLHLLEVPVVDLRPGSEDLWDPYEDGGGGGEGGIEVGEL